MTEKSKITGSNNAFSLSFQPLSSCCFHIGETGSTFLINIHEERIAGQQACFKYPNEYHYLFPLAAVYEPG